MRCEARDDLSHYMACPVLRGAVAAPAEASELGSGATFLGLRHLSEHRARPRIVCCLLYTSDAADDTPCVDL
eukprot:2939432-Pyramimonas_sp.AAC.1